MKKTTYSKINTSFDKEKEIDLGIDLIQLSKLELQHRIIQKLDKILTDTQEIKRHFKI